MATERGATSIAAAHQRIVELEAALRPFAEFDTKTPFAPIRLTWVWRARRILGLPDEDVEA